MFFVGCCKRSDENFLLCQILRESPCRTHRRECFILFPFIGQYPPKCRCPSCNPANVVSVHRYVCRYYLFCSWLRDIRICFQLCWFVAPSFLSFHLFGFVVQCSSLLSNALICCAELATRNIYYACISELHLCESPCARATCFTLLPFSQKGKNIDVKRDLKSCVFGPEMVRGRPSVD